jgi:glucoamylase
MINKYKELEMYKAILVLLTVLSVNSFAATIDTWFETQKTRSLDLLLENISRNDTPKGFVVASPSKVDPNYYYHWVRDAALVMRGLDKTIAKGQQKDILFADYAKLVDHHQTVFKLTNQGEPKFNADGTSFTGPWGRPQNDGPALRALAFTHYALDLIKDGRIDYVKKTLYKGLIPAQSVIKRDLEYVSYNWKNSDFDLWEEVMGTHFYSRMAQRSALLKGAELADALDDSGAAKWYREQARNIDSQLDAHWDGSKNYILTTINRVGGLDYKASNLDASVILAVNHSSMEGLSFTHDDSRVLNTYLALVKSFKKVYPINDKYEGTAIGRYPEDQYYGGNPWFLLTNAMAEYLNRLQGILASRGAIEVSLENREFYNTRLAGNLDKGDVISGARLSELLKNLSNESDGYLKRVKLHMGPTGRMDEQLDKYSGFMKGARDLTWSYASFITIK